MPPSALRRRQRCGKRARRGWGGWRSGPEAGALGGWAPGTPCFAGRPLQLVRPVPDRPVGIVSIPYFAGRPLQLGWRVWRIAGGGEFQSPTSRGGLCNRTSIRGSTEGRISFNPLLRGAASATGIRRASLSGWTLVSIPYFAGRPLQRIKELNCDGVVAWFQSPTSRGGLCKGGHRMPPCVPPSAVSIAYFVGRPLQRGRQNATLRSAERSFNPLLRGAASATPDLSGADAQPVCSFNPLLRGAASATVGGALQRPGRAAFQSPTSRGGLCNSHSELGYPSLASPPEAVVVVSSSASNWEGGGQPPWFGA